MNISKESLTFREITDQPKTLTGCNQNGVGSQYDFDNVSRTQIR